MKPFRPGSGSEDLLGFPGLFVLDVLQLAAHGATGEVGVVHVDVIVFRVIEDVLHDAAAGVGVQRELAHLPFGQAIGRVTVLRPRQGGDHGVHEPGREAWLGVMPRDGDVSDMRWFRGPKGVSCFHIMNAFEDAQGRIHMDQSLADVNLFPFIQRASGLSVSPMQANAWLARWTVDPGSGDDAITETVIGPPGGPGECFSEPVHVPAEDLDHGGWLLSIVNRQTGPDDFDNELWVLDADDPAAGSIARVAIPRRLRPQVHGWWVGAAQLAAT